MSTKYFCDRCGEEITDRNGLGGSRLTGSISAASGHKLSIEVIHSFDNVQNGGNWCRYCIIDAIDALDDRARMVR